MPGKSLRRSQYPPLHQLAVTYLGAFLESFANFEVEIFINSSFDHSDDIHSFEDVDDDAWPVSEKIKADSQSKTYLHYLGLARSRCYVGRACG